MECCSCSCGQFKIQLHNIVSIASQPHPFNPEQHLCVLYQATPTKYVFNIERVYLAIAVTSATAHPAISTALAGMHPVAIVAAKSPTTTTTAILTGHSSTGGTGKCCAYMHWIEGV